MKKHIFAFALFAMFLTGSIAPAHAQSTSTQSLTDLIAQLQAQVQQLQTQLNALRQVQVQVQQTQQDVTSTLQLIGQLREGMTGDQVRLLQTALAGDTSIYPEGLVTGYFGRLTALAVKRFQARHGLSQVGSIGPKTLEKLNQFLTQNPIIANRDNDDDDDDNDNNGNKWENRYCIIVPPGHLIAPGWIRKNKGKDNHYYIIPVCQSIPPGIAKKLPWWSSTSTPDTIAPVISGVATTNISLSGATITWTTDEAATSKVYASTTSPFTPANAITASSGGSVKNHTVALSGLASSTTYYYIVESRDWFGNTATSSQYSFTTVTGGPVDVTPPAISALATSGITTSSASITWTTDEAATTKVYYATSSPVNTATALTFSNATPMTVHTAPLSGLAPSTQYFFIATSADGAGNTATSTESSFTTAATDVTPPLISAVTASGITSSTATVGWTTNEAATSKIYYATSSPVDTVTASSVSDATLVTSHSLNLSGLTASSTYYYLVESKDASLNTATSTEFSFPTL